MDAGKEENGENGTQGEHRECGRGSWRVQPFGAARGRCWTFPGAYLTIERARDGVVPVAVWEVSALDEVALDIYEGDPDFYYKSMVRGLPVSNMHTGRIENLDAFIHIMHEERHLAVPSRSYVATCMEGYRHFGFAPGILTSRSTGALLPSAANEIIGFGTAHT